MKFNHVVAALSLLVFATQSRVVPAALILQDNFDSYADTAAMNAAWNVTPIGAGTLDTVERTHGKIVRGVGRQPGHCRGGC